MIHRCLLLETWRCSSGGRLEQLRTSLGLSLVKFCRRLLAVVRSLILVSVLLRQVWRSLRVCILEMGLLFCYPSLNSTLRLEMQSLPWVVVLPVNLALCRIFGTLSSVPPLGPDLAPLLGLLILRSSSVLTRP